ncbi:hypothetical protein MRB53_011705 [Persea americana]|uniref:Uncharacterized protein n=1 Tax=Persea americana TaxID=3435 RepID=A0ACC2LW40_PERAE|nr:hypothetical protein MRB53_011705 [Persea americana]
MSLIICFELAEFYLEERWKHVCCDYASTHYLMVLVQVGQRCYHQPVIARVNQEETADGLLSSSDHVDGYLSQLDY